MALNDLRQQSVLLVEDEDAHAEIVRRAFDGDGAEFAVTTVATVQEAREILKTFRFALVIADWRLPDGSGIDLLNREAPVPLLLMTSYGNEEIAVEAMKAGALDYVVKSPETLARMPEIAARALRQWEHVAARFRAEEELRQSEEKFRLLAEFSSIGIFSSDFDGRCLYANPAWQEITGRSSDSDLGMQWTEGIHPEDAPPVVRQWLQCVETRCHFVSEFRFVRSDASVRWVVVRAQPILASYVGSAEDITGRKEFEASLTAALREKETLIQEVHHRVKNNLQLISSLLQLQAADISDQRVVAALEETQSRVYAMALIHENLYQSESLDRIDAGEYLRQLVAGIRSMYLEQSGRVALKVDAGRVTLNMRVAVPLALIANELVTNAIKHAYPNGRAGTVRVGLQPLEGTMLQLAVADDGAGMPPDRSAIEGASLGLRLVNRLSHQLDGEVTWRTGDSGTEFVLKFDGRE